MKHLLSFFLFLNCCIAQPILVYPPNGAPNIPRNQSITFVFNPNGLSGPFSFYIQKETGPGVEYNYSRSGVTSAFTYSVPISLYCGSIMSWKIAGPNANWSIPSYFTLGEINLTGITPPDGNSPSDGQNIPSTSEIRFDVTYIPLWSGCTLHDTELNIFSLNGYNNIFQTFVFPPNYFQPNTTYYWARRLKNQISNSNWSIYRTFTTNITSVLPLSSEVPSKFELAQNFPNPFNPITKIKFTILKNSFVKLAIFNSLGKEIELIVNERLSAGTYEVGWNASEYQSGVYFYKLESGDFSETKKMVLIK